MGFFFRSEERIRNLIAQYLDTVDACLKAFHASIEPCIQPGIIDKWPDPKPTHKLESKADDLRRAIAMDLFGKSLLPESRGDIMSILEGIDKIPNAAETVLAAMHTEKTVVPERFKEQFKELMDSTLEAVDLLLQTADAVFNNPAQTLYLAKEVDIRESAVDRIERKLLEDLFASDIEKVDKILLRSIIFHIGAISDRAEDASDRCGLTAIKRRI